MLDCVCLISRNDRRVITISITISMWYVVCGILFTPLSCLYVYAVLLSCGHSVTVL